MATIERELTPKSIFGRRTIVPKQPVAEETEDPEKAGRAVEAAAAEKREEGRGARPGSKTWE